MGKNDLPFSVSVVSDSRIHKNKSTLYVLNLCFVNLGDHNTYVTVCYNIACKWYFQWVLSDYIDLCELPSAFYQIIVSLLDSLMLLIAKIHTQ